MTTTVTTHRMTDRHGLVRASDVYATSVDDLWTACTQPDRLNRWIAQVEGEPRLGGIVRAVFTSTYTGTFRVDACEAPHHLLLTEQMTGDVAPQLELWLTADGEGARLRLEDRGLPLDEMHFHGAGWQTHLEDLGRSLALDATAHPHGWSSERPSPDWDTRWRELTPSYRERPTL